MKVVQSFDKFDKILWKWPWILLLLEFYFPRFCSDWCPHHEEDDRGCYNCDKVWKLISIESKYNVDWCWLRNVNTKAERCNSEGILSGNFEGMVPVVLKMSCKIAHRVLPRAAGQLMVGEPLQSCRRVHPWPSVTCGATLCYLPETWTQYTVRRARMEEGRRRQIPSE